MEGAASPPHFPSRPPSWAANHGVAGETGAPASHLDAERGRGLRDACSRRAAVGAPSRPSDALRAAISAARSGRQCGRRTGVPLIQGCFGDFWTPRGVEAGGRRKVSRRDTDSESPTLLVSRSMLIRTRDDGGLSQSQLSLQDACKNAIPVYYITKKLEPSATDMQLHFRWSGYVPFYYRLDMHEKSGQLVTNLSS